MPFSDARALVEEARAQGYAVPAFNTNGGTYEIARAAIEVAQELRSPLILQTYEPNLAYRGAAYCVQQAEHLARDATVPIALHLDHGSSVDSVLAVAQAGYTSVMIDGSHLPLEENIALTRQAIAAVRPLGITVEAEVGHVTGGVHAAGQGADGVTMLEDATRFVQETGVDMLAIADGTRHGFYEEQTDIDLTLVRTLRAAVPAPLVQHGTCGIPVSLIRALVEAGIAKMNFGELFRVRLVAYFREYAETLEHHGHPWKILMVCKDRLKDDMRQLIHALGAEGRAN
jgi:ketose-bisphosphate aldolase